MRFDRFTQMTRLALAVAAIGLSGCGGGGEDELPRSAVQGKVTLDGVPLEEGVIRFVPLDGTHGPKTSVNIEQGRFSAEAQQGPVVGAHRVEIESTDNGGFAPDDETALARLKAQGVRRIEAVRVPSIYNTRSTLQAMVKAEGPNEFDFPLNTTQNHQR